MDDEDLENLRILTAIARSEGLNIDKSKPYNPRYTPIFKHPLPLSDHRYEHEQNLRRILSCKLEFQAIAAISQSDGWTLEEVYMRGGPAVLGKKNGTSPLHMAIQMNSIDCLMVLFNIGVNVNETNSMGYTPLHVAISNGFTEIEKMLREKGAKLEIKTDDPPESTVLDVFPEKKYEKQATQLPKPLNAYELSRVSKYY